MFCKQDLLAVYATTFLFVLLPGLAEAAPRASVYVDETALVFKPIPLNGSELQTRELPTSILVPGMPLTFTSEMQRACRLVLARRDDLLVFLVESKVCFTLTALFDQARESHPDRFNFGILERDRQSLVKGLESEPYLIMQPKSLTQASGFPNGVVPLGVCYCPNPPEIIFSSGFEELL